MTIAENFEEILSALNRHSVEYMVVGGFAVNFHGYNRSTSDLDIWVSPDLKNQNKIFNALKELGYTQEGLDQFLHLDFTKPFLFSIGIEPADIEIFNSISGVQYEEAEPHKIPFNYSDHLQVYFISLKDLIVNKMLSGRPKDKADVDELQRIQNIKKK